PPLARDPAGNGLPVPEHRRWCGSQPVDGAADSGLPVSRQVRGDAAEGCDAAGTNPACHAARSNASGPSGSRARDPAGPNAAGSAWGPADGGRGRAAGGPASPTGRGIGGADPPARGADPSAVGPRPSAVGPDPAGGSTEAGGRGGGSGVPTVDPAGE